MSNGHRNFELVVLQGHDLVHYWKDNSDPGLAWHRGRISSALYNGQPGVVARRSNTPWGPWSAPSTVFRP